MPVVSEGDALEVLEAAEQAFDEVALFVERPVVAVLDFAVRARRDDGLGASCGQPLAQFGAVIAPVGDQVPGRRQGADAGLGRHVITDIARGQQQHAGTAPAIDHRVELGIGAAARDPYAAAEPPFLRPDEAVRCTFRCVESIISLPGGASSATRAAKMRVKMPRSLQRT